MTLFIDEEINKLRQKVITPTETSGFFNNDYKITNENNIKQAIAACLDRYQQDNDAVVLFKDISNIIDSDVKYITEIEQESDAYLPLLLILREKLVIDLIRELNLKLRDGQDGTVLLNELVAIYHYLQHHFKNADWFENPQAYETTRLSNFKILAEIDEQAWGEQVRIMAEALIVK